MSGADVTLADLVSAHGGDHEVVAFLARAGLKGRSAFIDVLEGDVDEAIRELESNAQHHQQSNEDLLTGALATFLKGRGYDATSNENFRGHVDLLIKSRRLNLRWASEAKIHRQFDHDLDGVKQLTTRYASGYDTQGGFFLYVLTARAADVAAEFRRQLSSDPPCKTLSMSDDKVSPFRFRSVHDHDCGVPFSVRHHIVLLHHAPRDRSARDVAKRAATKSTLSPAEDGKEDAELEAAAPSSRSPTRVQ